MEPIDAVGLAEQVRAGELSPVEAVDAAVARIEARNPELNAVVASRFEEARAEAAAGLPDGPLRGVPFLVKELYVDVAGLPARAGSRLFADVVAERDSELVARYRRAGMVCLGTTNTPEHGLNATTEPQLHGPARNPWDPSRSTGGSSGGSAAAVASGMVPVAIGNDGGGSIRIPSSRCGLFGLKPTRLRAPVDPYRDALSSPLSVNHALTTTVRDSAVLLDVGAGPLPGDPYAAPAGPTSWRAAAAEDPGVLRIGVATEAAGGEAVHPAAVAAVERMAAICEGLGHRVEPVRPAYDPALCGLASATLLAAGVAATVDAHLERLGRELAEDDLEPFTRVMVETGRALTGRQVVDALRAAEVVGRQVAAQHEAFDLLLTPTVPVVGLRLGVLDGTRVETIFEAAGGHIAFTSVCNVTGQPAMSVPGAVDDEGLPVGVQFAAPFGDEVTLLRLATQIEDAAPWPRLAPGA